MSPLENKLELELERERERKRERKRKLEQKLKLSGVSFVRGAYARSPQVQCVYAPSGLSVPSNVA